MCSLKIGIVGSGIAGLTCANLFKHNGHSVALFEKQDALGMDAHSQTFQIEGKEFRGDVPSRMFNELEWPELVALYDELEIEYIQVNPTQSFGRLGGETYLNLDVANRPQLALNAIRKPGLRRLLKESKRLSEQGTEALDSNALDDSTTFGQYLTQNGYSKEFIFDFLYPTLSSTVLTCSYNALNAYPAKIVFEALGNLVQSKALLRTRFGTKDVVSRLTNGLEDIRLGTKVHDAKQHGESVELKFSGKEGMTTEIFDFVVVATQANHVSSFVSDLTASERNVVEKFTYENVKVVVHTDSKLMPDDRGKWGTFNMLTSESRESAMCSVWMNQFHQDWNCETDIFQTICPSAPLSDSITASLSQDAILATANLQRPVVNKQSFGLWEKMAEIRLNAERRIKFVGSYACPGVPLLETGVKSSRQVYQAIVNPLVDSAK